MERLEITNVLSKLDFPKIEHGDTIVQLGSCFSTHISEKLRLAGFKVLDNPLGVIFHPIPLINQVLLAFGKGEYAPSVQKNDVWLGYDASSTLYAMNENAYNKLFSEKLFELKSTLLKAKFLFVTLGSAHAYRLKETGQIVANCHQQVQSKFTKELIDAEDIAMHLRNMISLLKEHNPKIVIIFTVSPVRYVKDGLIENNLSKGVLFQSIHQLSSQTQYFPSYEIVNDVLRDYSFFESDYSHPNSKAIDYVWEAFRMSFFTSKTNALTEELMQLRKMENHKILYPESIEAQKFQALFHKKRESFLSLHPTIYW